MQDCFNMTSLRREIVDSFFEDLWVLDVEEDGKTEQSGIF